MVDQDVKAEAKKIENLANRSLNGDHQTATEAANKLRTESVDVLSQPKSYRDALQKQLDSDRAAEVAKAKRSDTADKWLPEVVFNKDEAVVSRVNDETHGWKDIQTFHKDGRVGYQANHFSDEKPMTGVGDSKVERQFNADDGTGSLSITRPDKSVTNVDYDASGTPTKIAGINGQTWEKQPNNEWAVKDAKGNPVMSQFHDAAGKQLPETRQDVVVLPNGDIKYGTQWPGETRVVHPDGSHDTTFTHGDQSTTYRSADGSTLVQKGNDVTEYNSDGSVRTKSHARSRTPHSGPASDSQVKVIGGDSLVRTPNSKCLPGDPLCTDI